MKERYVRPPLVAGEPPLRWAAVSHVWRLVARLAVLFVVLALAALIAVMATGHLTGSGDNPGVGGPRTTAPGHH